MAVTRWSLFEDSLFDITDDDLSLGESDVDIDLTCYYMGMFDTVMDELLMLIEETEAVFISEPVFGELIRDPINLRVVYEETNKVY
jgi:hypothetical protein